MGKSLIKNVNNYNIMAIYYSNVDMKNMFYIVRISEPGVPK